MAENSSNRGGGRAHKFTSSDPHFDSFNSSLLYDRKIRIFETAGSVGRDFVKSYCFNVGHDNVCWGIWKDEEVRSSVGID